MGAPVRQQHSRIGEPTTSRACPVRGSSSRGGSSMAEVPLPSGMVTFLLTDVEGSTRIWESHRGGARIAFERHDALVAEHLASYGGARPRDQGEGDSAFAVFARASAAIECAL